MTPTSAQQAALSILLQDVEPLIKRSEEAAATLARVREELDGDLSTLGELVQRTVDAQPALLELARKLSGSAARIETAMQQGAAPSTPGRAQRWPAALWSACATSALLSAVLVSGVAWIASRDLVDQARIGRALQSAWPSLDAPTRLKMHELLGKS